MAFTATRPSVVPGSGNINFLNKFEKGTTTFKILSESAFYYFEYWNTDGKTTKLRDYPSTTPGDIQRDDVTGEPKPINLVMSFVGFHYEAKQVKVFQINKKSVREKIEGWADNPRIGDIRNYDIEVIRSGEGLKTKYEITQFLTQEPPSEEKIDGWDEINLERLAFGSSSEATPAPIPASPPIQSAATSKFMATVQKSVADLTKAPDADKKAKLEAWIDNQLNKGLATPEEYDAALELLNAIPDPQSEVDLDDIPF